MSESQRQKQKIQTRNHIIEISLTEFAKGGLTTTRTSDIATAAKVSHGTVFSHFQTREILLNAVIEEFGMRISSRLHELINNQCGIRTALEAHIQGICEYEMFYTRLISEAPLLDESARNTLIMIQSTISFHLSKVAEEEMKNMKIIEMPFNLMFNTWLGLIHYYLINSYLFAPNESVLARYSNELIEHYIKLISYKEEK